MRTEKVILYGVFTLGVVTLVWTTVSFVSSQRAFKLQEQLKQNAAFASEQADPCQTPPGYTDEQWREHMSHHPDRYQKCLTR